ncbi:MAG TPA: CoA-acylating methylmalonate-semialdehyde dehydrogenase [Bdellovibrionota bacterium]|nr:CoA-acylating methylmalonate-semialdehyde dehydrogenase [Bdellovibrionota bacterium]
MTRDNVIRIPSEPVACGNFVGGKWVFPKGEVTELRSPYSGTVVGRLHQSGAGDVDEAVRAASKAAAEWRKTPIKERCSVLMRFREVLLRDLDRLAHSAALEAGKTHAEARAGLLKGIEVLEFALSLQNLDQAGKMEVSRGVSCEYRRDPLGVVAGITPFNFPAMVPMWMIPIAIAVGNAFVWKPSDKTPLTSIPLANAAKEAGIPDGVLTVVQGGRATVEAILDHPGISAAGFVGSSAVARSVYLRGSTAGKRVLALGGAKNHIILMPDADPEMASRGITDSYTGCAGQRCMAASVLLAVGDPNLIDPILEQIVAKSRQIKLGSDMGALITRESRDKLAQAIDRAKSAGARVLLDGREAPAPSEFKGGNWLAPTILDGVKPGSEAACDELFGPILSVIRVRTLSEALAIQNQSKYGNAASVFTSSGAIAQRVSEESHAGMIGINIGVPVPREPFSFGGIGDSRFGHGDITGHEGVAFWSQLRKVTTKWIQSQDHNWMS